MKNNCLFLFAFLIVTNISAQNIIAPKPITFGIHGGFNLSNPKANQSSGFSGILGVYVEIKPINVKNIRFQTELLYKPTTVGNTYGALDVKTLNIELPILVKISPTIPSLKQFSLILGFAPTFPFYSKTIIGTITKFSPAINLSYFGGISFQLPKPNNKFEIDVRHCGYIADNYNYIVCNRGGGCGQISNKTSTFDVALLYNFGRK